MAGKEYMSDGPISPEQPPTGGQEGQGINQPPLKPQNIVERLRNVLSSGSKSKSSETQPGQGEDYSEEEELGRPLFKAQPEPESVTSSTSPGNQEDVAAEEAEAAGGAAGGGGGGRGGRTELLTPPGGEGPKRPEKPPEMRDKEWETSPERGWQLAQEIIHLRTKFSYEDSYRKPDSEGILLNQIYDELQEYVNAVCKERNKRDPWDREKAYKNEETPLDTGPGESKETYWSPSGWAGYYNITAQTPEQFITAQDTFLQLIRRGSIGKSPEEVFKHLQNFKDAFGAQGSKEVARQRESKSEDKLTDDFMKQLRLQFEAQSYIFLADYSNETYNPKTYNQAMTTMALHEGPDRWVSAYRAGEGQVAAFTHILDQKFSELAEDKGLSLTELFYNPVGARGELDIVAQHFLQDQLMSRIIELGMGIQLKDYDPREDGANLEYYENNRDKKDFLSDAEKKAWDLGRIQSEFKSGTTFDKLTEADQDTYIKSLPLSRSAKNSSANLRRLGMHMSKEELTDLFEGLEKGDAHLENYGRFGKYVAEGKLESRKERKEYKRVVEKEINGELKKIIDIEVKSELPKGLNDLYESVELGRIQQKIIDKKFDRSKINKLIEGGEAWKDIPELTDEEKRRWKAAYDQAETSFELAFQMQGITGEKVRRGKGFLYATRNPHMQTYQNIRELGDFGKPEDKSRSARYAQSRRIGRILTEIRKGKRLDIFTWGLKSNVDLEQNSDLERICAILKTGGQLSAEDRGKYDSALAAFKAVLTQQEVLEGNEKRIEDVFMKVYEDVFKRAYEGVDKRDSHRSNYDVFMSNKISSDVIGRLPRRIKMSIDYGRILKDDKKVLKDFEEFSKKTNNGEDMDELTDQEKEFYGKFTTDDAFKLLMSHSDQEIYKTVLDYFVYQDLSEADKANFVDSIPVHLAESAVQYVVNRTKILHAGSPAKDVRRKAVNNARKEAIKQIQRNGFEAKFELPKIRFDAEGNVVGAAEGNDVIDIKEASESVLARYTTHTYWAYQPENRHMLLAPQIFETAKVIREGLVNPREDLLRPDQVDMLATQLLLVDPTLNRVARVSTDLMEEEITILNAAVEESYQDHWQLVRDLYAAFLPDTGNRGKMRIGYNFEDWGGSMRFIMGARELVASQPARFARRLGAGIAFIPMEIDSMPAIWGQNGVAGAINMFTDQIKNIAHQGVVGQFGITKFIDQMSYGERMRVALFGTINPETGIEQEGLYKKPTNNSEKLNDLYEYRADIEAGHRLDLEVKLLHAILESFGRLDAVLKLIGAEASLVRNAQGVLWLKDKEIFLDDGMFNPGIDIDNETGTARHSEEMFFDSYMKWLLSDKEGGGAQAYKQEQWWYKLLNQPCLLNPNITRKQWMFNKMFSG